LNIAHVVVVVVVVSLFSRYTVLSKRKLIQLVEQKHVNGWDDPRMPTLSGMRRRGVPPSALRSFCEQVGISKADSNIDFKVLEDCIRDEMDKTCRRAFCILKPLKLTITNFGTFTMDRIFERYSRDLLKSPMLLPYYRR
jgi:glutamyl/glutaminyl-tRNA synthetase